jgi:hypothetical protein
MIETGIPELETLARDAAREIAGPEAVDAVEIETGIDLDDRPIYHFTFLIDQEHARQGIGMVWTRLSQKLR